MPKSVYYGLLAVLLSISLLATAQVSKTQMLLDAAREGKLDSARMTALLPSAVEELSGRKLLRRESPELVTALADQNTAVRVTTSGLLQLISARPNTDLSDFERPLLECLRDSNTQVRANCLFALSSIAATSPVINAIMDLLHDPAPMVRIAAISGVLRLRPTPSEGIRQVASALSSDQDDQVRSAAAASLATAGDKSVMVVDPLRKGLVDRSPSVAEQCVIALGVLDPTSEMTVAAVRAVLNRKDLTPTLRANVDSFLRRARRGK